VEIVKEILGATAERFKGMRQRNAPGAVEAHRAQRSEKERNREFFAVVVESFKREDRVQSK